MISLVSLLVQQTKDTILAKALDIAETIDLPVTTWQPGDPTRSLFMLEAEILAKVEEVCVAFIESGFLEYAQGAWLKVVAKQVFNVDVPEATFATTNEVLTNAGGGFYEISAGDLTLKNTATGKTYRNTTGGTLASGPGTSLTVSVVAEEAGSDSSAGAGEIDELVTTLLGVTCSNPLAAVGLDEQDRATTIAQCRAKLGTLSPNGPADAYAFVAREPSLSGTSSVTRVRVYADSDTGDVTVYVAGPSGPVLETERAQVEAAILKWATPLCITPTVLNVATVSVPVAYTLWIYKSVNKTSAEIAAEVETALEQMFAAHPIGGDAIVPGAGFLYLSLIHGTILGAFPQAFRAQVSVPAADVALGPGQVAVLSTVTATVNIVVSP